MPDQLGMGTRPDDMSLLPPPQALEAIRPLPSGFEIEISPDVNVSRRMEQDLRRVSPQLLPYYAPEEYPDVDIEPWREARPDLRELPRIDTERSPSRRAYRRGRLDLEAPQFERVIDLLPLRRSAMLRVRNRPVNKPPSRDRSKKVRGRAAAFLTILSRAIDPISEAWDFVENLAFSLVTGYDADGTPRLAMRATRGNVLDAIEMLYAGEAELDMGLLYQNLINEFVQDYVIGQISRGAQNVLNDDLGWSNELGFQSLDFDEVRSFYPNIGE